MCEVCVCGVVCVYVCGMCKWCVCLCVVCVCDVRCVYMVVCVHGGVCMWCSEYVCRAYGVCLVWCVYVCGVCIWYGVWMWTCGMCVPVTSPSHGSSAWAACTVV